MGVSLKLTAYSGKESELFQKHLKAVKFCIENELSFPKETEEFFKGRIDGGDLSDFKNEYVLEYIENGVTVPVKHSNIDGYRIEIKPSDIPEEVDLLVIQIS